MDQTALTITVYGGAAGDEPAGEIGGNKILIEWGGSRGRAYLLDFGTRFAVSGKYFAEFLQPRAAVGLRDYLRMGLLPPLEGIYRDDLASHDPDLWMRYREAPGYRRLDHLDAVLLSHGHVDHSGALGFLGTRIPVFTGLMTATIAKGMQDSGGGRLDYEFCYTTPKGVTDEPGVIKALKAAKVGRPFFICEDAPELRQAMAGLQSFWQSVPGPKTVLNQTPLQPAPMDGLRFYRVDHSIPGSGAFAMETPIGWVVYSGDLRRHGHSKWRTEQFAQQVAELRPALLIVEGTKLQPEASIEEPTVQAAADQVVARESGLVIADFSPRNIERLRTFHDIAKARGRRLVVTSKDAYLLAAMHVIDPHIPDPTEPALAVFQEPVASRPHWERDALARAGSNVVDAATIRAAPGEFILCLSYFDITSLIDLDPSGGTYIYSSSEAYSEDQQIDQKRLLSWLGYFGVKPVGGLPGAEEGPYHVSGHIDGPSMEWLIETINPGKILPVHTQKLQWFEQRWGKKVIRADYATAARID